VDFHHSPAWGTIFKESKRYDAHTKSCTHTNFHTHKIPHTQKAPHVHKPLTHTTPHTQKKPPPSQSPPPPPQTHTQSHKAPHTLTMEKACFFSMTAEKSSHAVGFRLRRNVNTTMLKQGCFEFQLLLQGFVAFPFASHAEKQALSMVSVCEAL